MPGCPGNFVERHGGTAVAAVDTRRDAGSGMSVVAPTVASVGTGKSREA
ncbi:MAG TPA: hypothetical protein VKV80_04890 [Streptosporangiaceae bacterium]|nr:hypothetical protein [Streptosporangiaceae bacterium]